MSALTERQKLILSLVIHDYIETASPVGSKRLVTRYNLDFSSATVRNELAVLTEQGYLRQPHTSAGRVPTEDGYRYFVQQRLLQENVLPASTQQMIRHQFYQMRHDMEQWMRLAASVLAHQSQATSLVTAPHPQYSLLKHLELIATRGRQVLMVLVTSAGEIHQRLINVDEPIDQHILSRIANHITHSLQGKDVKAIQEALHRMDELERQFSDWVLQDMRQADSLAAGEIYLDGMTNMLSEPEFANSEEARRALHVLEERSTLHDLLAQTVLSSGVGGVHVLIGGEGNWDELSQCSLVLARYGSPGLATGTLGVLGPMRMSYGRTISTVRFLSGLLSDLVVETLGE